METITIEFNKQSKAGRVLLEFMETFVKNTKDVRIKTEKEGDDVLEKIFFENNLTDKEKAFYRRYKQAIDQSRAIDEGEMKAISLEKTLHEI